MTNNVFAALSGQKNELVWLLKEAIRSLETNETTPTKVVLETAPGAYDKGLVDDKTVSFFGFAFRNNGGKAKIATNVVVEIAKEPVPYSNVNGFRIMKITDRQCEKYKVGAEYVCPCGEFKTLTITGFKKHFNRCVCPTKWDKCKAA